ncbi:Hypothetical protein CINCED_3A011015 [Cinara cedri]|uniref:Uncharacterized protein n=1 Tax=Cinara cedri TaxID=506608 RepID=A0A5E4NSR5_9HEMI|nr:Hypothetical protein CINCED_3A011015 [Cinara cedri]
MTCNFFLQSHVHTSYFPAYAPNAHYIPKEYIEMLEKVANDFMISNGKVTGKCEDSKSCSACLKVVNHSLINIRVLEPQQCCYDESASSGNLNRLAICPKPNYGESLNNWERSVVTPDQKPCLPCPDTNHDQRPYPDKPRPDTNYDQRPYPEKPRPDPNPNPKPHPDDRKGCQDDGEPYTVVAKEITADHADPNKECGYYAGYYKSYGHVGHYGFNTACILKKWFPNFDKNPALKEKLENVTSPVMAGNFKLAIVGDNIDYTWAKASDMWYRQCQNYDDDKACTWEHNGVKAHSTCYTAGSNWSTIYSHNFFSETECPNLITSEVHAREKPKEIYIKLVEPIVLYDHSTQKIIRPSAKRET